MHFHEEPDAEVAEYRTVSRAAVGSLILGLLSPAALVDPAAWCIPPAGILAGIYALWRIRQDAPALAGRKAALWGLWLALFFAAAAAADYLYYRYRIRREAEQFAAMWFELLAEGRPERAFQLAVDRLERQPFDDRLPDYYRNNYRARAGIERYVAPAEAGKKPQPVRTLLALGKNARVRCLDAPVQDYQPGVDVVHLRYAVTFEDAGTKKTFLLIVQLLRRKGEDGRAFWKIGACSSADEKPESDYTSADKTVNKLRQRLFARAEKLNSFARYRHYPSASSRTLNSSFQRLSSMALAHHSSNTPSSVMRAWNRTGT